MTTPPEGPVPSGTGLEAPANWTLADAGAETGEMLVVDLTDDPAPAPPPGWLHTHSELAARQADGSIASGQLLGGAARGFPRRVRGTGEAWLRHGYEQATLVPCAPGDLAPGDRIAGAESGARATVAEIRREAVRVEAPDGLFRAGEAILRDGAPVTHVAPHAGAMPRADAGDAETLLSDWSGPRVAPATRGAPRLVFELSKRDPVIGEAVHVTAHVEGTDRLRPRHEILHRAKARGPSAPYRAFTKAAESPFGRDDRTLSHGDVATFAPEAPGPLEIDWTVTWRDGSGALRELTETLAIAPRHPFDAFAPGETYDVDATGAFAEARPASNRFTDLDAAIAAAAGSSREACLIRIAGSATYACAGTRALRRKRSVMIVGLPSEAGRLPRLRLSAPIDLRDLPGFAALHRVELDGGSDTADPARPPGSVGLFVLGTAHASLVEVAIENCSIGIYGGGGGVLCGIDFRVDGSADYASLSGDPGHTAFRGYQYLMRPATWRGENDGKGEAQPPFLTDHGGTWRESEPRGRRGSTECCGFVLGSWTGPSQPVRRLFGTVSDDIQPIYFGEAWLEGSGLPIHPTQAGARPMPQDVVIRNVQIALVTSQAHAVACTLGGTTVENLILAQPDLPPESSTGLRAMIQAANVQRAYPGDRGNRHDPVRFAGLTLLDLRSPANAHPDPSRSRAYATFETDPDHPFDRLAVVDALVHAPHLEGGTARFAPLDLSPRWRPLYAGRRVWGEPFDPGLASPPAITAVPVPGPGSPAVGAAEDPPLADFLGRIRPVPGASTGAVEPL